MREGTGALWGLGGLIVGAWVGSRFSYGPAHGGAYAPAYPAAPAPVYGYPAPGYYTGDRPCHEDKQDDKIACIQAQLASIGMSDKKNEEIDALRYQLGTEITDGKIYRATCHKPDGRVYLSPSHIGNGYFPETRALESRPIGRDGRDGCNRNNDCWNNGGEWY